MSFLFELWQLECFLILKFWHDGDRHQNDYIFLLWLLNITVTASMPGYKSKNTSIWLDEGAMSVDFILDPETTTKGKLMQNSDCYCGNRLDFVGYIWGHYFEAYIFLAVVLVFICFLFQRKMKSRLSKQRLVALPKRIVVWNRWV